MDIRYAAAHLLQFNLLQKEKQSSERKRKINNIKNKTQPTINKKTIEDPVAALRGSESPAKAIYYFTITN